MPATIFLANKLLDHQTGKAAYTMPTVYVGLSSTTPSIAGTGVTEPSGGAYARVPTSTSTWTSASAGATSNAQVISFATATANWASSANMTHGVLFDSLTGGNALGFGALATPKNVLTGDTPAIAVGDLDITLS